MAVDEFDLDIRIGTAEQPIEAGEPYAQSFAAGRCITDGTKCD